MNAALPSKNAIPNFAKARLPIIWSPLNFTDKTHRIPAIRFRRHLHLPLLLCNLTPWTSRSLPDFLPLLHTLPPTSTHTTTFTNCINSSNNNNSNNDNRKMPMKVHWTWASRKKSAQTLHPLHTDLHPCSHRRYQTPLPHTILRVNFLPQFQVSDYRHLQVTRKPPTSSPWELRPWLLRLQRRLHPPLLLEERRLRTCRKTRGRSEKSRSLQVTSHAFLLE